VSPGGAGLVRSATVIDLVAYRRPPRTPGNVWRVGSRSVYARRSIVLHSEGRLRAQILDLFGARCCECGREAQPHELRLKHVTPFCDRTIASFAIVCRNCTFAPGVPWPSP
jgi:hypothetical protein